MKRLLFLIALLICKELYAQKRGIEPAQEQMEKRTYSKKYAFLIGINTYKDSKIPQLNYAVNDAKYFSEILINKLGFDPKNIIILTDSIATRENILKNLTRFIQDSDIDENSQLLVYFAGHGTTLGSKKNPGSLMGFLLPHDAEEGNLLASAIDMDKIRTTSELMIPKHILYLVDACYGGIAGRRAANSNTFFRNVWSQRGREVITAGSADETVVEDPRWEHSAFMKVIIKGVEEGAADSNNDKVITTTELYSYIQQRVPFYAKEANGQQSPQFSNLSPDNGTFLFELKDGALDDVDENTQFNSDAEEVGKNFLSSISIKSNVDNSRVYLDGREIGFISEGKLTHKTKANLYKLEIKKDKYETASTDVLIRPDTTNSIEVLLSRRYVNAKFNIDPVDAVVKLDNQTIGVGKFTHEIPKGSHTITIEKNGYKPEITSVNMFQDDMIFEYKLKKIIANVEVNSLPIGALVVVDGDTLGKTPYSFQVGYGSHNLVLLKNGFKAANSTFDVKESGPIKQDLLLEQTESSLASQKATKLRKTYTKRTLVNGIFSGATYLGAYSYIDNQYSLIESGQKKVSDPDLYKYSRYATLGLSGIFALGTTVNFFKLLGVSKKKIMKQQYEERFKVSFISSKTGSLLVLNKKF